MGLQDALPAKAYRKPKPTRRGAAFVAMRADDAILLRKRPVEGLLGGMTEVPGTPWRDNKSEADPDPLSHAPLNGAWIPVPGIVRHTFTHFHLELAVFRARVDEFAEWERCWRARVSALGA